MHINIGLYISLICIKINIINIIINNILIINLPSFISKVSQYKSSNLNKATASFKSNPKQKALIKSVALYKALFSSVCIEVFSSTAFLFVFILICNFKFSTMVLTIFSQTFFKGVIL